MTDHPTPTNAPKRTRTIILIALAVLLLPVIGIQLVPVSRANPPVTQEIDAPDEVMAVLRRSCYDCHSNETRWPWYSYVAPVSWRVAGHVDHGRANLNFSEWDTYDDAQRRHHIEECYEEVSQGYMPLSDYLGMHPEAELSDADRAVLKAWAEDLGEEDAAPAEESDAPEDAP